MRILIRGMKMPKNCHECPLFESKYRCHGCHAVPKSFYDIDMWEFVSNYRPSWCPLVELPPHGRLIDADELSEVFSECHDDWVKEQVKDAPTIIEADKSDMDSFIRIFKEDDEEDGMDSFIQILKD